ncbi:hypothetical protein [Lutibacter sp. B1]|uniref:DUF6973 domain-containing protein n=1 Tax=Lutibacter sp. B1 TaxID=2725996 RepID=UPI001456660D|nr:hypothetical protein [Lutibacter sp. B1]NLP57172.1 hypothetical protein [Lutibacter sp. B1]
MKGFRVILVGAIVFLQNAIYAQSDWEKFKEQSSPIKLWVLYHPFKAKKALQVSLEAQKVADSVAKTNLLDGDKAGGQVDAFRHAYWMARLHQEIGKNAAYSLGKAHERENYKSFKKHKLEDGEVPDKASKEMDLFNNKKGLSYTQKGVLTLKKALVYKVVNAVLKGDLKIIKKDSLGNYTTCKGDIIPSEELLHKWKNKKCIISSEN